jgi:hypothetical protein
MKIFQSEEAQPTIKRKIKRFDTSSGQRYTYEITPWEGSEFCPYTGLTLKQTRMVLSADKPLKPFLSDDNQLGKMDIFQSTEEKALKAQGYKYMRYQERRLVLPEFVHCFLDAFDSWLSMFTNRV